MREISKKVQESRLKWNGHVVRSGQEKDGDRGAAERLRGRPRRMWLNNIRNDLSERGSTGTGGIELCLTKHRHLVNM